jgi:hypothetical protein
MSELVPASATSHRVSIPKYLAPVITLGTTIIVRRGMIAAYRNITGKPAPTVQSRNSPLLTKMLWSASMASVVTLVESLVLRAVHEDLLNDDAHMADDAAYDLTDGI